MRKKRQIVLKLKAVGMSLLHIIKPVLQPVRRKSVTICSGQSGSFWLKVLQELVRVPLPGKYVRDGIR